MAGNGNKTLILNPGSSSLKFRVYHGKEVEVDGVVDKIGGKSFLDAVFSKKYLGFNYKKNVKINDFKDSGNIIIDLLEMMGIKKDITKIGYRIVHGEKYNSPIVLNSNNLNYLKSLIRLAPLHQKQGIEIIELFMKEIKNAKHIACFDTMFHKSMPKISKIYALPYEITDKYGIERYGFHGISHLNLMKEAEKNAKKKFSKIITCQLGNGVSICAIKNGKSIDTSMGFTPLEGLIMGTRCGSIDPAIIQFLNKKGMSIDKIFRILENESGLKALSGATDVRDLLINEKKGDKKSEFALEIFSYQIKKNIGAYISALNGVDAIVLGGGISRAPEMRKKILSNLENLGIKIDNAKLKKDSPAKISSGDVEVWIIETDEQKQIFELMEKM